jgi:spermidine synthase
MSPADTLSDRDEFARLGPASRTWTLFVVSVLGLFLELMLIRWVGTEIRIFAYLQNTVLVVCFLGLGMGCLTCRRPVVVREMLWPLILLSLLLAVPLTRTTLARISEMLSVLGDFLIWANGESTSPLQAGVLVVVGLGLTLFLMVVIGDIFVPIGRMLGRLMDDHPRTLLAYSVNVAGGLVGIWLFVLLSAWQQPPWVWFAVTAGLLLCLILPRGLVRASRLDLGLLAALVLIVWFSGREPGAMKVLWSPYQKLVLSASDPSGGGLGALGKYMVTVNNAGYQAMIDLSEQNVKANPARYPAAMRGLSQYDIPYLVHPRPRSALIVGAGCGNDASGALRQGVERIKAVEIDPAIIQLGRLYHPERPYDSPKVQLVNDDARSFFSTCRDRFDIISFGLLDSHTTTAMTNARLDHYVYTIESLRHASTLLADGGIMVLSFESQKPFVADRIAKSLREVFNQEPICFRIPQSQYGWGGVMFIAGNLDAARSQIAANPRLAATIAGWQQADPVVLTGTTPVTTDNWPYIYLKSPSIPLLYFLLAGLLIVLFLRCARRMDLKGLAVGWDRTSWHFFFLGAAFLLLEVQNISKASVVLGNTWFVNAVIISGILAMVLLANLVVSKLPKLPDWSVYGGLFVICLALSGLDIARLGFLPFPVKAALVGGLTSLPILFSGVIFARSFTTVTRKDQALGANLIGALIGGLLQSITFIVGIQALLLIVGALYFAALLTRPRIKARIAEAVKRPKMFKFVGQGRIEVSEAISGEM